VEAARAERTYARQLKGVGAHVGQIIAGFEPGDIAAFPSLHELLERYALALEPWATRTASQMLNEVNDADRESWRALGNAISQSLKFEIEHAPVGDRMRELLGEQVDLIQSIPRQAAERVHELTIKGLSDAKRFDEYIEQIERSGDVTQSRAVLIARTEVSRTASVLTESRCTHVGLLEYFWRTANDQDVRPGHKEMAGKVCQWASPPAVNESGRVMHFHAGQIWNCRCYPEPIISDD